ncbi:MAG: substrate-binding domain-containing protein [Chloroflexi bacterium]|nr:substrate-binding domain-containing protein [Chloroflexota bacterium]MYC02953.1 substrate-binding domain-containing protein [Chloroflexota bacterium]
MSKAIIIFLLGVLVSTGTLAILADNHGESDVRVSARKLADGRVEIAVQQRDGDRWSERQLPDFRFLPIDAPPGEWRSSSAVSVTAPASQPPLAPQPEEVYCLVTHRRPGDEAFWGDFEVGAVRWQVHHAHIEVIVKHGATGELQAQMIRECIDQGVDGIGSSLADPDAVQAALLEADAAGIPVVTFNSGLLDFTEVKSRRHIGIDEIAAGATAGELFVEAGIQGRVLCVIHEERNTGLVERCDGLEIGYDQGEVERLYVTGVGSLTATTREISERLSSAAEPPLAAILSVNTQVGLATLEAIEQTGSEAKVATFDQTTEVLQAIVEGRMLFAINTSPFHQAWLALSTLLRVESSEPRFRQLYGVEDTLPVVGQLPILIGPRVYTDENAADWLRIAAIAEGGTYRVELD